MRSVIYECQHRPPGWELGPVARFVRLLHADVKYLVSRHCRLEAKMLCDTGKLVALEGLWIRPGCVRE